MREMVNRGRHIALSGPPGVGKDTAVQELAATQGHPLVTIGGDAGFRRKDIVGSLQIRNGQSYMEVAEYAAAVVNGWWALVTEVNAADADALLFINTQLAPPYVVNISGKSYPVHPDFRLFVSYNPGLVGTKPLPQSFKDRFFPIQVPFFSEYQLGRILTAHGMPEGTDWGTFITKFGVTLWEAHTRGQLRYQVTSRRLQDAVELMLSGVVDNPREAIRQAVIAAIDSSIEAKVAETVLDQQRWSVY
jgi:midasin (ATPase involved in ribosome maturation)